MINSGSICAITTLLLANNPFFSRYQTRSASPLTAQLDASAASDDENEMESIITSSKRGHHDSSDEEPNSPVSKKPASGSPASGRDGTHVPTGTGRGDLSNISTFCPNPPRPGGRGSSGAERSPIWPPDKQKHKAQIKPLNQSKSRVTKNTLIDHGSQLHYAVEL